MAKFMISFLEGAITLTDEQADEVSQAAHAIVDDAKKAGIWVFGGGLRHHRDSATIDLDGGVSEGRALHDRHYLAGLSIIEAESRADALEWARRLGTACGCPMEVREFLPSSRDE